MAITTLNNKKRPIELMLVEDNEADTLLLKRAFNDVQTPVNITVATDGQQAIDMLNRKGEFKETPHPDLILLDINLPRLNGKDVVKKIKENEKLRCIPVIILTSSGAEMDIIKSYQNYANSYIVKPSDAQELGNVVKNLELFWFQTIVTIDRDDLDAIIH